MPRGRHAGRLESSRAVRCPVQTSDGCRIAVRRSFRESGARQNACGSSASLRNRAIRVGKCVLRTGLSVVAVLIGNWLWHLMQSSLW